MTGRITPPHIGRMWWFLLTWVILLVGAAVRKKDGDEGFAVGLITGMLMLLCLAQSVRAF